MEVIRGEKRLPTLLAINTLTLARETGTVLLRLPFVPSPPCAAGRALERERDAERADDGVRPGVRGHGPVEEGVDGGMPPSRLRVPKDLEHSVGLLLPMKDECVDGLVDECGRSMREEGERRKGEEPFDTITERCQRGVSHKQK